MRSAGSRSGRGAAFGRLLACSLAIAVLGATASAGSRPPPPAALPTAPGASPGQKLGNPNYKLEVSPGLAGYCRLGWLPVHVAIEATRDFDGELVAVLRQNRRGQVLYEVRRPIQLAAGSKKDYHLYLRHESTNISSNHGVEVYLDDDGRMDDTAQWKTLELVSPSNYLICVVSDRRRVLAGIGGRRMTAQVNGQPLEGGTSREFKVAQPELRELPDKAAGYTGVDFLLLYQTPLEASKLSHDRMDAIVDFARSGGTVVLAAGDRAWFARKELRPIFPAKRVAPAPQKEADRLEERLRGRYTPLPPGPKGMTVHKFEAPGFAWDASRGFYSGNCGLGRVAVWQLDPMSRRVRSWSGLYSLWADLGLRYHRGRKPREEYGYGFANNPDNNDVLRARMRVEELNLSRERAASAFVVVFLVVFYLVLVGPVNYFVLRRLDMRALSIVTIPLLAAVFVLLTFAVGYLSRGVTTVGRRLTLAAAGSGAVRAYCVTSQSVFPSGSMLADVSTDGRGLVCPLLGTGMSGVQERVFAVQDEDNYTLESHPMRMWEMAYFEAVSTRPLGGSVRLEALTDSGGGFDGRYRLVNNSSVQLENAFVTSSLAGGRYAWIGEVKRGVKYEGRVEIWRQGGYGGAYGGTAAPQLILENALKLWFRGELGGKSLYPMVQGEDKFAEQASTVIRKDPRLEDARFGGRPGMMLFAFAREEFEPIRLNGRSIRAREGESRDVLVIFAEVGGRK
jgi:hypothetical protein